MIKKIKGFFGALLVYIIIIAMLVGLFFIGIGAVVFLILFTISAWLYSLLTRD